MERRELFGSLTSKLRGETPQERKGTHLRPPYSSDESLFQSTCASCEAPCVTVCEEDIIVLLDDNTPVLNLLETGCTYCDACALACEPNVLTLEAKHHIEAKITINKSLCMSWESVMCFSCKEPCLDDAIAFKSLFQPVILQDNCSACGFCIGRCPTAAIEVEVL